jgi:hypothetical protein
VAERHRSNGSDPYRLESALKSGLPVTLRASCQNETAGFEPTSAGEHVLKARRNLSVSLDKILEAGSTWAKQ